MIMVTDSAKNLKQWLQKSSLNDFARVMVMRIVLAFICHRGRMSCSQAGVAIVAESIHRGQVTRFLARRRWQSQDFNAPLVAALLQLELINGGRYLFVIDATLCSQAGHKTKNTYSTGNRQRRPRKGRRYGKNKHARKTCHSFTFGLLISPSGYRIPFQIPHYTKEYCIETGLTHQTTAEAAAQLIRDLPLPDGADVVVLADTAYDAEAVRQACQERDYLWIFPMNPERVYAGPKGQRPKVRTRLKDWTSLSLRTIRLCPSTGNYATYRRLSRWRVGPKMKSREYHAYQEIQEVQSVGRVQLVFSTMKPDLKKATPDDVKILMTNATDMSLSEVLDLYSTRWQIELFFKELKSTLGFDQYRFQQFEAVEGWVKIAITTILYLEWYRATQLARRRISEKEKRWWSHQRLHGLCLAFQQHADRAELQYISERLKTPGGIAKLKRLLANGIPQEYRVAS
jgi:hypothetical protein